MTQPLILQVCVPSLFGIYRRAVRCVTWNVPYDGRREIPQHVLQHVQVSCVVRTSPVICAASAMVCVTYNTSAEQRDVVRCVVREDALECMNLHALIGEAVLWTQL